MHYNVQIHVQEVEPKRESRDPKGYLDKGAMGAPVILERRVKELLSFSVAADSETEAYAKAIRILETSRPIADHNLVDNVSSRPK